MAVRMDMTLGAKVIARALESDEDTSVLDTTDTEQVGLVYCIFV